MIKFRGLRYQVYLGALLLATIAQAPRIASAQSVPTFRYQVGSNSYTLAGRDPSMGGTTKIPTVVVPVVLSFESEKHAATPIDATKDVAALLRSPVFSLFPFSGPGRLQYGDAMLRATFPNARNWHTILARPEVKKTIHITVPRASGYVLTSKKSGRSMGIADLEYVQREVFKQVSKENGKLIIALTHNTAYYAEGDATICCLWGTHGSDAATGNSFVLASYLSAAPSLVKDQDVQPLTEQLAEFINDPLHDPLIRQQEREKPGNRFPPWMRPPLMHPGDQGRCGGTGVASAYFLLEPTDTNHKNNFPYSTPFVATDKATYHVENVALLPWYVGASGELSKTYSFPDAALLNDPAQTCPARRGHAEAEASSEPRVQPQPRTRSANRHALIGYWNGSASFPLRDVSPQWDIIIVAFATPDRNAPEGTLVFNPPQGISAQELKTDIARLKSQGKKMMISLGGGGQFFTLNDRKGIPVFVSSVSRIVKEYGFDGIDLDFETPSLMLDSNDTDFKHPTTPSIVNLIAGLRQLRTEFGPGFMISLVPEGPQIPAGHLTYGGQFGSYLPIAYGIRDILSFVDVQDYNTPPLEGLDGEIYQAGSVDYHAAMTELVLQGFNVGRNPADSFPALPQRQVAVGFLTGETTPQIVSEAMNYIIEGQAAAGGTYRLRKPTGYPEMIGAMFWDIDDDRRQHLRFSNIIGPELHDYSKPK